jgi:primosomal protein N' (replication factor Y)
VGVHAVSVVPDVSGIDRVFDYLVPEGLDLGIGDIVRVPLHGRKVKGWVVGILGESSVESDKLKPVIARIGCGPSESVVDLARWTAERWCGRWRSTLVAASPPTNVRRLPAPRLTSRVRGTDPALAIFDEPRVTVLRRGPKWNLPKFLHRINACGPVLVIVPTNGRAVAVGAELRRAGLNVAIHPEDWASGAGGVDVVIGARSAVFASVHRLASIVVVDEHDDSLQESRNPTWHAREVAIERARRNSIPCFLVSPIPSSVALVVGGDDVDVTSDEVSQWPTIEIVDRTKDERWEDSLVSTRLVELCRDEVLRVVVVLNTKGRSRLLACAQCRLLVTCERCLGSMSETDGGLRCTRCEAERPRLCAACGSLVLRNLRPGIKRLAEDLLKASGRRQSALAVVDAGSEVDQQATLFVGTEAAIHRVRKPEVVVFADIDQELYAPRFRASEITAGLVSSAARAVGDGRVVLQTHSPGHRLIEALQTMDLDRYCSGELLTRSQLRLPPYSVLGSFGGAGGAVLASRLVANGGLDSWANGDETVVRFRDYMELVTLVNEATTDGAIDRRTIRVHVEPPRV